MLEQMLMSFCQTGYIVGCETVSEMSLMAIIVGMSSAALLGTVLFRRIRARALTNNLK